MSVQARSYLRSMQIHPALDVSGLDPVSEFGITSVEALRQLEDQAYEETQALGHPGRLSMAVQRCYQLNLDQNLPSLEAANGAISQTLEQQQAKANAARANSARYLDRSRISPELADLTLDGQDLTDWSLEDAHNRLAVMVAELPPGRERDHAIDVMSKLDGAPSDAWTGISWEVVGDGGGGTFYANSDSGADPDDLLARGRQMMNLDNGTDALGSLAIKAHRYGTDPLFAGITALNPDGSGTVETFFDPVSQGIASDGMHQGDAGANTFTTEE